MENVVLHHVFHNVRCLCSQLFQAILLHKCMEAAQNPCHLLNKMFIAVKKGGNRLQHLTYFYNLPEDPGLVVPCCNKISLARAIRLTLDRTLQRAAKHKSVSVMRAQLSGRSHSLGWEGRMCGPPCSNCSCRLDSHWLAT